MSRQLGSAGSERIVADTEITPFWGHRSDSRAQKQPSAVFEFIGDPQALIFSENQIWSICYSGKPSGRLTQYLRHIIRSQETKKSEIPAFPACSTICR